MARVSICLATALLGIAATHATAQTTDFKPVTEEMLANPDPADWLMISRTFDQHRFSPLNQINKDNVGQLRMAWTRGLPAGSQESTPIVYRGVMYMNVPGGTVQAVNATNGDLIWEYARDYPKHINPRASRHKNLGIYEDMIYFAAPDGVIVALDIATGKVRWETKTDTGGITAGGILVADGKVLTNRMCMHMTRDMCFISAHDARTGKELWKFYTTAAAGEPGGDSWADMPTEKRAASPWGLPGSYDPKRRVTYWGIANPDPYTRLSRHGSHDAVPFAAPSNLYSNSTVALDIATGKLVWHYQELPGDDWDADHNQERILLRTIVNPDARHVKWRSSDLPRNQEREVVVTVGEGGGLFMVERDAGKFLWAHPFPYDNPDLNMNEINPETGQTHVNVDKLFKKDGQTILGCFHNTRGLWSIAYHPEEERALRSVPGPVPVDDLEHEGQARLGAAGGRHASRHRSQQVHESRQDRSRDRRDEDTLLAAAAEPGVGAGHRRRPRVLGRRQPALPRLRRRQRQGAVGDGGRRHRDDLDHHLRGGRQAVCRDPHRRRPVGHRRPAQHHQEVDGGAGARP